MPLVVVKMPKGKRKVNVVLKDASEGKSSKKAKVGENISAEDEDEMTLEIHYGEPTDEDGIGGQEEDAVQKVAPKEGFEKRDASGERELTAAAVAAPDVGLAPTNAEEREVIIIDDDEHDIALMEEAVLAKQEVSTQEEHDQPAHVEFARASTEHRDAIDIDDDNNVLGAKQEAVPAEQKLSSRETHPMPAGSSEDVIEGDTQARNEMAQVDLQHVSEDVRKVRNGTAEQANVAADDVEYAAEEEPMVAKEPGAQVDEKEMYCTNAAFNLWFPRQERRPPLLDIRYLLSLNARAEVSLPDVVASILFVCFPEAGRQLYDMNLAFATFKLHQRANHDKRRLRFKRFGRNTVKVIVSITAWMCSNQH